MMAPRRSWHLHPPNVVVLEVWPKRTACRVPSWHLSMYVATVRWITKLKWWGEWQSVCCLLQSGHRATCVKQGLGLVMLHAVCTLMTRNTVLCMKLLLWGWHAMVWLPPESLLTDLDRLWPQLWVKLFRACSGYICTIVEFSTWS